MKAIVVDDEKVMIRYFLRESKDIPQLNIAQTFTSAQEALEYTRENPVEIAFLDIEMPDIQGLQLAKEFRKIRSDMLIVFITGHDYVRDSNLIGVDYYLMKPYTREMLELMMERLVLLALRQQKKVYLHMFGTFTLTYDGKPIPLVGKAKEILAYLAAYRGKEVSNRTIFSTLWEGKPYDNSTMTLYFHALKKLKAVLKEYGLEDLLISNAQGQMLNTDLVDCDYYHWQDNNTKPSERYQGEFLSEYCWSIAMQMDMDE